MNLAYPLSVPFFLYLCFLITFTDSNGDHFTADNISINCGSIGTFAARNGREWIGDVIKPKKSTSSFLQIQGSSSTVNHHNLIGASDSVPHKTARASRSRFSYSFRVSPGQKILHLHFNPSPHKGFKGLKDLFTVEAGPFILLSNFSASLTADADVLRAMNSFSKEFYLNIQEDEQLNVTFSPEASDTYAFVNGIEIISVPESVSYFQGGGDIEVQVVGHESPVYVDQYTALEVIHRLNIRHTSQFSGDFDGTLPLWAMRKANKEKNETWKIAVGVGFGYMIRLHFSEIGLKIAAASGDVMMFKVLVNEMTAHTNIELWKDLKGDEKNNIPWYKDYLVMIRGQKKEGKRDLSISLHSNDDFIDGRGLISGFEIFKLSNPDNSLACPNPVPSARDSPSHTFQVLILVLGHRNGCALIAIILISLVSIIVHRVRELWEEAANSSKEKPKPSARANQLCRRFSLTEIQLATRNFSDALLIGRGGFGKVYKGIIYEVQTKTVAVKRLKSNSMQGVQEFLMEIETLSELRHVNLVSLIGYCNEHREMILVYDYMANGTLSEHLYKLSSDNCHLLTWKQRLNICIGSGRGLDYLHTGHGVIHRDVKTLNILLDHNFVAKVSDFGLAKHEDRSKLGQSHISTQVKGTKGYLDPHYLYTRKLTRKTDTYAFGVVLFEVLCGRPAVDLSFPEEEHILTTWALDMVKKGEVDLIVASILRDEISPASLKEFVGVAERCLSDEPKNRPTMSQVVQRLELALELQEAHRQVLEPNKRTMRPIGNDGNDLSGQPAMAASTDVKNQTNFNSSKVVTDGIPYSRKLRGNAWIHELSRLWPLDKFRNRVKSLSENELSAKLDPEVHLGRLKRFSLRELQVASDDFSNMIYLDRGGYDPVYKGRLADGGLVAVKRLKKGFFRLENGFSPGKELEFQTEVKMISMAVHRNLLKLRGFCMTPTERLLVYPYMANGSVASCLRERSESQPPLDWLKRKRIALGSARGIAYLHENCHHKIIHRDVRAANIFVDKDFEAVVGEFGLSKLMDYEDTHVTITDLPARIVSHLAPENNSTLRFSEKTDVYSYGVMLLELITGKSGFDLSHLANDDDARLFDWVKGLLEEKNLETLVDADLQTNYTDEEVEQMIQLALLCTHLSPKERPKMSQVVRMLEGDGLAERWEEWQREEIFHQEANQLHNRTIDWLNGDSSCNIRPDELSGPR